MRPNTSDDRKNERNDPPGANDERGGDHHENDKEREIQERQAVSDEYGGTGDHLDDHGDEPDDAAGDGDIAGRGALVLNLHQYRIVRAEARNRSEPHQGVVVAVWNRHGSVPRVAGALDTGVVVGTLGR